MGLGVSAADVVAFLRGDDSRGEASSESDQYAEWVTELDRLGAPAKEVALPDPAELGPLLDRLGVHADDAADILATRFSADSDPELWWLLQRCHHTLEASMGDLHWEWLRWPHLPARLGAKGRFFYVHVFLAAIPTVLRYHEERHIPSDISWATLADLGRQIAIYRRIHAVGGLDVQFWFSLHFRGLIYDLGRLQFNRGTISFTDEEIAATNAPFRPGDTALGVHIPESGPMTPQACDESFRRAREFYDRYFPEERYRYAVCSSWLLDPQLAEYLPADSNIVRFQRRFTLVPGGRDGDSDVFQFVFRKINPRIEDLPQRTTLERAIVDHLRSGRHWQVRSGWLVLDEQ
ncbi:MAG TPA: acyltransferase domain-containing protein [Actinopolymorphaceae bacterium]